MNQKSIPIKLSPRRLATDGRPKENNREYVYRVLRENIMGLYLEPGTALNENELSELFGVSRTPVHEAVTKLRDEHLVDVLPQSGSFISQIDLMMSREGHSIRIYVEPHIITELAGKVLPKDLSVFTDILDRQEDAINSDNAIQTFFDLDNLFHEKMYTISNMPHIWQSIRGLSSHFDRIRYLDAMYYNKEYLEHFVEEHKCLFALLVSGIPNGFDVQDYVERHVSSYKKSLMPLMQRFPHYFSGL